MLLVHIVLHALHFGGFTYPLVNSRLLLIIKMAKNVGEDVFLVCS